MDAIERIFCATDFSEAADEAIRQADQLARVHNAQLQVYHAMPSAVGSHPLLAHLDAQALSDRPSLEARLLEALAERVTALTGRGDEDVYLQVGEGEPYAAIVSRAERSAADLIVVGGQGPSGANRLLGDVAERVVRYAHCPVLVARPGPKSGMLLVGTDLSDPSLLAVAVAADQARLRKARVTVVHSLDLPDPTASQPRPDLGDLIGASKTLDREGLQKQALERLLAAIARFNLEADAVVTEGHPASDLPLLAEELKADLVIVATAGRTGLSRVMQGSVAEAVARESPCSVLVVRLKSPDQS